VSQLTLYNAETGVRQAKGTAVTYLFSLVGASRRDVRAACSGATRSEIDFWVARATGQCRRATRRAERRPCADPIKARLLEEGASLFRSAGRQPAPGESPVLPIFQLNTFNHN
jgi:hypothetical protein